MSSGVDPRLTPREQGAKDVRERRNIAPSHYTPEQVAEWRKGRRNEKRAEVKRTAAFNNINKN